MQDKLKEGRKYIVLDGLRYIKTYTIDEFKAEFNVSRIFIRVNPNNVILFNFGTNIGVVSNDNFLSNPVISVVCNSAGKVFCLLHNRDNTGKIQVRQLIKTSTNLAPTYSRDYDSYYEYNKYVEDSRLDAFEGDESNYWNID